MTQETKTPRKCLNCGVSIENKRPQAKFCSPECSTTYHNARYKEQKKQPQATAPAAKPRKRPTSTKARKKETAEPQTPGTDILEDLITLKQAREVLQVQKQTLYKWNKDGILTIYAITERKHYVRRSDLVKLLKRV